jgi:imidazolonepropionase-like amidohydrolase
VGPTERVFVVGGAVWSTEMARFEEDRVVLIEGGVIESVGSTAKIQPNADGGTIIDVAGAHVIPGMVDCHYHLISRTAKDATIDLITESVIEGVMSAGRVLEAGVTTVRDPGSKHRGIYTLRRLMNEGKVKGPRAFVSGPNPTGTAAPQEWRNLFVDGVEGMRSAVRQELLAGADFIKIILSRTTPESNFTVVRRYLTDEEIAVACSEAHLLGARVTSHCEGIEAARAAVKAGMDCMEHALNVDDELATQMADQGTFYVPTMWVFLTEPTLEFGDIRPDQVDIYRNSIEAEHQRSFERTLRSGVVMGAGTDSIDVVPSKDVLVRELEALVAAGMTKTDALQTATINGARVIGQERRVGSLEPGRHADVVAVDGNPIEDLRALARPLLVLKGGDVVVNLLDDRAQAMATWSEFTQRPMANEGLGRGHWLQGY